MDVSTKTTPSVRANLPVYREISCGVCGSPRTGLPPGVLCPECGTPPPVAIVPVADAIGAATDRSEQAWPLAVALGLVMLIVTSAIAVNVALIMSLGGLTVVAVNAPAPKVVAAAL